MKDLLIESFESFRHSFMIQLLSNHLRRNLALIAVWLVVLGAASGSVGRVYGIHFLFLDPEYLEQVNFLSFFIIGITFGMLTMSFHVTSYILDSHRFPFVGVLERPFAKFAVNNSLIPLIIFLIYGVFVFRFQLFNQSKNVGLVVSDILGLVSGRVLLQLLTLVYFRFTNKDIFKYLSGSVDKQLRKAGVSRDRMMKRLRETRESRDRVRSYFDLRLRVRSSSELDDFYDRQAVLKVFDQNQLNAVAIGLLIIGLILIMGSFMDNPYFQIPAAASTLLLMTILVILIGAISYWFRRWALPFAIVLMLAVNLILKTGWVNNPHEATGLSYEGAPPSYDLPSLRAQVNDSIFNEDVHGMLHRLENWKQLQAEEKPKMVLLSVSGGGQRAALWTVNALQTLDSVLDGSFLAKTSLITGASGGMIGAAYFRELYLRSLDEALDLHSNEWLTNISKDNLNPVIFSLVVNDAFLRFRTYTHAGKTYAKDRGYAFETNLNRNIGEVLNKNLLDYQVPEESGIIPTLLLSPTIANDGRKLYIATRSMSFMNASADKEELNKIRGVDFLRFFEARDATDLHFMTALRMSASFPYITPRITLPSEPPMEIMDAGISDNFGVSDAVRFLYVFRSWLEANTSGVALVIIRDTDPNADIMETSKPSLLGRLTYPISSVYNNLARIQDRNNDARLEQTRTWFDEEIDVFELIYTERNEDGDEVGRASLSWHLTTNEKQSIIEKIQTPYNQKEIERLGRFLSERSQ